MFGKKTLFIVGAGASAELGFPLGYSLAKIIQQNTSFIHQPGGLIEGPGANLIQALGHSQPTAFSEDELKTAARILNRGATYNASIDDFLSVHAQSSSVVQLGKLAIIQAILDAERGSKLHSVTGFTPILDTRALEDTWLLQLSQILLRGHTRATVRSVFDNLAFVTFNYDRSLEVFLIHALKDGFAITHEQASEIVKSATIIHAYGSVGGLSGAAPAETFSFGGNGIRYGEVASTKLIQTYSESAADPAPIHGEMERAQQIIFLGFAFHPQNMKLLKPRDGLSAKRMIATTFGLSELDVVWVRSQLRQFFRGDVQARIDLGDFEFFHPNAVKCVDLMRRYSLTLSQG